MSDHLEAALHFEGLAGLETRPAERERLLATAGEFRWLAIADGHEFVRQIPKRPPAPSVRRRGARKWALRRAPCR